MRGAAVRRPQKSVAQGSARGGKKRGPASRTDRPPARRLRQAPCINATTPWRREGRQGAARRRSVGPRVGPSDYEDELEPWRAVATLVKVVLARVPMV